MALDHDRLFKEVLTVYIEEFIQLFFPEVHVAVDFSNVQFLAEEVFSDVTQGEKYRVDILAKTSLKMKKRSSSSTQNLRAIPSLISMSACSSTTDDYIRKAQAPWEAATGSGPGAQDSLLPGVAVQGRFD